MSREFDCEFVYDDCVRKRVMIRRQPTGKPLSSVLALDGGDYAAYLTEIEEWLADNFDRAAYTVYRVLGMLVVGFDRDADLVFFKLRWHE